MLVTTNCENCSKEFQFEKPKPSSLDKRACSKECSYKLRIKTRLTDHPPLEKTCIDCKETFQDTSKKKLVTRCQLCVNSNMVKTRKESGSYVRSDAQNEKLSESLRKKYESGWNPNTEEHREKLSQQMKSRWSDGTMAEKTKETSLRKYGVYHHTQRKEYVNAAAKFSFAKQGYRKDLNVYFRSAWEANFARYLNFLGKSWVYEPRQFLLSTGISYTPDFYLPSDEVYYEIKGAWVGSAKEKVRLAIKEHGIKLIVIDFDAYQKILNEYSTKILEWE
jgi:DNA-directed RNA polymerase subunit RPC12/RpoP